MESTAAGPAGERRSVGLRRAVGSSILLVAVAAVVLFAVPLAVAASRLYRDEAAGRLSSEASRAAGYLSGDGPASGARADGTLSLPGPRHPDTRLGVYDATGSRLSGTGPARSSLAAKVAADQDEEQELIGGDLAVAVPVRAGEQDVVVRAAMPYDLVLDRTWVTFAGMAGLAVVVLAFAALVARRRAASIAAPLEEVTRAARALGDGDFAVVTGPSAIEEAAAAGQALQVTARRLATLVERAQSFAADASHQVRTPMTALRLGLENALLTPGEDRDAVIRAALRRVDRVEATVDELLDRIRDPVAPVRPLDVLAVVRSAAADRWEELARARGRALRVSSEAALMPAAATPAVLHQVLDVLVSNSLAYGAGTVAITIRTVADVVAVDVADEGPGFPAGWGGIRRGDPDARGSGIGLPLARDLAQSIGGRLSVTRSGPGPVVTLLLARWTTGGPDDA